MKWFLSLVLTMAIIGGGGCDKKEAADNAGTVAAVAQNAQGTVQSAAPLLGSFAPIAYDVAMALGVIGAGAVSVRKILRNIEQRKSPGQKPSDEPPPNMASYGI